MDNMNGSKDVEDGVRAESHGGNVGIGVCRDWYWACDVVVVNAGCPSEAHAVEGANEVLLWRNDIKKLNEDKRVENIVWEDGKGCVKWRTKMSLGTQKAERELTLSEVDCMKAALSARPPCSPRAAALG